MNYARIYDEFIADRRLKPAPDGYSEVHHVVPRSMGGGNNAINLIRLTPEDHYFAHLLLAKAHGGKMWNALYAMCHLTSSRTGRDVKKLQARSSFGHVKRGLSAWFRESSTGRKHGAEARAKVSNAMTGNKHFLGRRHSQEAIDRIRKPQIGKPKSEVSRERISQSHTGVPLSDAHRRSMAVAHRLRGPTSGLKGVYPHRDKWMVRIQVDGKQKYIGVFADQRAAGEAYDVAAKEAWGVGNCYLNFPTNVNCEAA